MRRRAFTACDTLVLAALLVGNWVLMGMTIGGDHPSSVEVISPSGTSVVPLSPDRILEVPGPLGVTVIEVGADGARIRSSPCPLKICVETGGVTRDGGVAACLPNRVAIRLLSSRDGGEEHVDAVGR